MQKTFGLVLLGAIILLGAWVLLHGAPHRDAAVACTAEAKICPDGTAVGRGGPTCEFAECPVPATTPVTATLAVSQGATLNGLTLTVTALAEDSRCPTDVQCMQAGTVRVSVTIGPYGEELALTLGEPQVVRDSLLLFEAVTPAETRTTKTIKPSEYRFTFTLVPLVADEVSASIP